MGIVDPVEVQRLADVEDKKRRGKGTPKKAKTKGTCSVLSWLVLANCLLQRTAGERLRDDRLRIHAFGNIQCGTSSKKLDAIGPILLAKITPGKQTTQNSSV
jgi:hypothetical protein